jgi:hypothetical protein
MDGAGVVAILAAAVLLTVPTLLTALGEVISERAGVLNLGLEGIMILGAFSAYAAQSATDSWPLALLDISGQAGTRRPDGSCNWAEGRFRCPVPVPQRNPDQCVCDGHGKRRVVPWILPGDGERVRGFRIPVPARCDSRGLPSADRTPLWPSRMP